jgi:hypothetical protein
MCHKIHRSSAVTTITTLFSLLLPRTHFYTHMSVDEVIPVLSGLAAFGATLAVSTLAQKFVGISTATKVLPTVNGFLTVCAASLVSERVAILAHEWRTDPRAFQKDPAQRIRQRLLAWSSSGNPSRGSTKPEHLRPHSIDDINSIHLKQNQYRRHLDHWQIGNVKFPIHEARM